MARKIIENPENCPLIFSMNVIGSKWKPLIVYTIGKKKLRFGKLNFLIPAISKKILTEQLKELEYDGILIRKQYREIPPRVEYSLTESGKNLLPLLITLCNWSKSLILSHKDLY
ncbi:helix-turn-helix domain-containing protein [uncultured Polaribacter sp.]|uniref:winged helix-turn-helix transcriptional regulator n=1 Tax=uncultured Polaribacter sp. TaxID=174711 RepID=UPI00263616C2|nr:helix-turn-helix domain-containing protein [uncultured Polaribacter sp.]